MSLASFFSLNRRALVTLFLSFFTICNSALAEVFERHPNAKGLTIEAPRPDGYTSLSKIGPNHVFQWGKKSGENVIFWLQLGVYDFPTKFGSVFKNLDPLEWAKIIVPEGSGNIVSATRSRNKLPRFIDIEYDHVINVAGQKWLSRNLMRTFILNGRTIAAECIASIQISKHDSAPTAPLMARLLLDNMPDCELMLNGLRVSE